MKTLKDMVIRGDNQGTAARVGELLAGGATHEREKPMKSIITICFLLAILPLIFVSCADDGDDDHNVHSPTENQVRVLAFYYPWYRTPDFSGFWGHWQEEGHDPDTFIQPGRRDIASKNYPMLDAYDSLDPDVIDLHIQQSVNAGIDAWIVSWWGDNTEIRTICDRIAALQSPLKIAAYYEKIPGCSEQFCFELPGRERIAAASTDITSLLEALAHDPAWLTVEGEPVLFVYIRAMTQGLFLWDRIIQEIEAAYPVFISGDASLTQLWPLVTPGFDQMHIYNPTWQMRYMGERTLRYGAFCEAARSRGHSCALTVIPGYDDSALPSRDPIVIDRENGALYQRLWATAVDADPDWILITSFNEWHEGSEIEPSLEFGDAYLSATTALAESFQSTKLLKEP